MEHGIDLKLNEIPNSKLMIQWIIGWFYYRFRAAYLSMKADHIIGLQIDSTLKLFSFFYKKTLQVVFFPSLYREVFLNTYLKGVISIVNF